MTPGTGSPLSYGYDPSGNLTSLPTGRWPATITPASCRRPPCPGVTTSYAYNADGQRLTATQGSAATAAASWNGAAELTAYSDPAAAMSAAGYDGNGLRQSATTTPAGGSATTQHFVWDTGDHTLLMDSANAYVYGIGSSPAEQVNLANGNVTYLDSDVLGSVRGIVGASGSLTASTSYDAWGNPQTSGGLASYTPFGYAGGYTDPTGLIYLVHRYYDPATGQFLSVDPDIDQTGQPYAYTDGNPVGETDPLGLQGIFFQATCYCYFAAESTFQHALALLLYVGGSVINARVYQDPNAYMRKYPGARLRKIDIYVVKYDYFNPRNGWGWINELKIGSTSNEYDISYQYNYDRDLLRLKHAYGSNQKGSFKEFYRQYLPINGDAWWFAPDASGYTSKNAGLFAQLISLGINVFRLVQSDQALPFPRRQSKKQKGKETKEIESNDPKQIEDGMNSAFQPCLMMCQI